MPRSGWLALGAVIAALAATQPWLGRAWLMQPATWLLMAASWLAVVTRWRARRRRGDARWSRVAPFLVAIAGVLLIGVRLTIAPLATDVGPAALPTGSGPWTATVEAIGNPRDGKQVATVLVVLIGAPAVQTAITAPADPPMTVGDTVRLSGRLQTLPGDDYGAYLVRAGMDATLASRTLEVIDSGGSLGALVDRARRSAADGLAVALPEPEAGLAAGILIGLRDRVDRDLASAFTAAGVTHVVAISGWNIAIVAALVGVALRRWPRRRRSVVSLAVIGVYTVLTGASASVVRAALMTTAVTLARESGRAGSAASALGWAAVVMLVADPATVGDAGFQLSSLATAGLIAWATPLTDRLRAWHGGALPGWLCDSLGVSFAAEAATLPVVLLAFGRLALLAPIVNLLVVPLVPAAMAAGTIAMAGGLGAEAGLPREVAAFTGLPGWIALTVMVDIVQGAAALPFSSITLTPPLNVVAAGLVAALVGAVAMQPARAAIWVRLLALVGTGAHVPGLASGSGADARVSGLVGSIRAHFGRRTPAERVQVRDNTGVGAVRRQFESAGSRAPGGRSGNRRTRLLAVALVASIAGLVLIAAHRGDGTVRIDVLDVGQGDAILVRGDHGSRMLVDGGPDPGRLLVALDAQLPPWDRRIDLLVLTHPHQDHVAGMARLLDRYRVRRVLQPGMIGPGPGYRAFTSRLLAHDLRAETVGTGDRIALDSVAFQVLWPDPGSVPTHPSDTGTGINNVSIVLLGAVDGHRFLLMGDVEEEIDPILLLRGLPRVEVLKVAHHGSRTSSTGPLLDAVQPAIAVISAGAKNPYGHPAQATIGRLQAHHAAIFRTDLNGTVDVALENGRWVARPQREAAPATTTVGAPATTAGVGQFRCGIPQLMQSNLGAVAQAAVAPAGVSPRGVDSPAVGSPAVGSPAVDSPAVAGLMYDRPDVRARPSGDSLPASAPAIPVLALPPFPGRGRDRRLARRTRPGQRPGTGAGRLRG